MNNSNENNAEVAEQNLNPLGAEEMNSVIKSFQESSFNHEKLYQKEEINFVKKSLYELAIESDKKEDVPSEDPDVTQERSVDETKENFEDNNLSDVTENLDNEKDEIEETKTKEQNDLTDEKNKIEQENKKETKIDNEKLTNEVNKISENTVKTESTLEDEKKDIETSNVVGQTSSDVSINDDEKKKDQLNEENSEKDQIDNKEFEEQTLEALDSVREAVSKSLDRDTEKNKQDENLSNEILKNIEQSYSDIEDLFTNIKKISIEQIEQSLKDKILEISSEIAGQQIDKMPQKFLAKIKKVLNELTNVNNEIVIQLSNEDYETLKKIKEKELLNKKIKFESNQDLKRGDFSILSGGLLHSVIHSIENNHN